jgi:hypothetical protein
MGRRFSTHEPSASGMYSWLFSLLFFPLGVSASMTSSSCANRALLLLLYKRLEDICLCLHRTSPNNRSVLHSSLPTGVQHVLSVGPKLTRTPRNELQDPYAIPQRSRRPQVARGARPHARLDRRCLVHRTSLRARLPRRTRAMGEPGPGRARGRGRYRGLLRPPQRDQHLDDGA